MKKQFLFLIMLVLSSSIAAQYPRASLWTGAMANFAAADAAGVPSGVVLFTGSSTFTMWNSLATDFPESKVLNRAFGGSMMTDLIYYFGQVVAPYTPRQVVLYEGDNDLHETSKTPEEFMEEVVTMCRMINIYYPNARILLVSIKPSPSRTSSFSKYRTANTLMQEYAAKYAHIDFADTWTPMLKTDGNPETSYFLSDMLHMNASGYAVWKNVLTPYILKTPTNPGGGESTGALLIDFGSTSSPTQGNWNNIHDHQNANQELIDDGGNSTGIRLAITDPFYNGFNTAGATAVTGEAEIFPSTATMDNFFGHANAWGSTPANPTGVIRLSGLSPSKYYSFTVFGSRAGASDNRETKYEFKGAGDAVFSLLNTSSNSSRVAVTKNVRPDSEGVITMTVSAGPANDQAEKFFYLGAMKIHVSDFPLSVKSDTEIPVIKVSYLGKNLNVENYSGDITVYDTTGKLLSGGRAHAGSYSVNLLPGIYLVRTEAGVARLSVEN
ncbi:MAG: GDSL-type esterase/lipase family protein [Paludibacter sp.]|jgi:lysophospholipase L1-like esterase|nr:GDSL-type esterase/lipase family protein [Paludibacter sp.]